MQPEVEGHCNSVDAKDILSIIRRRMRMIMSVIIIVILSAILLLCFNHKTFSFWSVEEVDASTGQEIQFLQMRHGNNGKTEIL